MQWPVVVVVRVCVLGGGGSLCSSVILTHLSLSSTFTENVKHAFVRIYKGMVAVAEGNQMQACLREKTKYHCCHSATNRLFKLCIIAIHSPSQSTKHTVSYLSHNLLQKQNDSNASLMFVMKAGQFIQGQPLHCASACALCRALNKSSCWDRMCTKPWRGRGDIKHCTQMGVTRHWSELTMPPACKTKKWQKTTGYKKCPCHCLQYKLFSKSRKDA